MSVSRIHLGHEDHPRSRGVYDHAGQWVFPPAGSSPLARGLRLEGLLGGELRRIIPARAGFTPSVRIDEAISADHPRSRGVYAWIAEDNSIDGGSSPLARGLLVSLVHGAADLRIIPARAGFTAAPALSPSLRRDHPRSRGVYARVPCTRSTSAGSSPLARGLRGQGRATERGKGIIPARAGFTVTCQR